MLVCRVVVTQQVHANSVVDLVGFVALTHQMSPEAVVGAPDEGYEINSIKKGEVTFHASGRVRNVLLPTHGRSGRLGQECAGV